MKVRVSYTVDVDDDTRRAINQYHGLPGLASRQAIRDWYEQKGSTMDADLPYEDDSDGPHGRGPWGDE